MKLNKHIDLIILTLYPAVATIFSLILKPNAFCSVFIFFGVPSLYLSLRQPDHIKKAIIFSLAGLPMLIIIDYIAHITQAWLVPHSIFPFRLFGYVTIENMLWIVFHLYLVVIYFEHFVVHHFKDRVFTPKIKYLYLLVFTLFTLFLTIFFINPQILYIPYWYMVFGILLIGIPIFLEKLYFPKVFSKLLKVVPFFFYLLFAYEITALQLNWWSFPGKEFIGWVSFFGISFPLEEMVFWIILFVISVLSCYEYFDDDEK